MTDGPKAVNVPALAQLLPHIAYVPNRVAHHAQHSGYGVLFSAFGMRQGNRIF